MKENEKVANLKLEKVGNLRNLGKIIPSFRFCPTAKIENSDLKISEKIFRDFRDFRGFRVFDLQSIFVETFILALSSSAVFRLQNDVSDFFQFVLIGR